jgi:NAD(P)-dependent dehydrogenase (short-subunit alcohol dehydrogenase family)
MAQVALVTAGSAGLGAATARLFASAGMRVIVNYSSNTSRADTVVEELKTLSPITESSPSSPNFAAIKADLSKRSDIVQLVKDSVALMGRLDIVFSNGGWTHLRNFMDLNDNVDEEDWDRCFNMNVKSHLFLMHAAREHLEKTEGAFITTASFAGVKPSGSSLVRYVLWMLFSSMVVME